MKRLEPLVITMMIKNKVLEGELYLLAETCLWSFLPIFSILAFSTIQPLYTLALSTVVAAVFFAFMISVRHEWHEIKIKKVWKDIFLMSLIIGILFYSFLFIGIGKTTAGNAGIMMQMEVFFSIFILGLWKKEKIVFRHMIGAMLMVIGAIFILFPGHLTVNTGDLIILMATAIPPIGNYFTQKARKKVSANTIMFLRSIFSGVFLLLLALIFETRPSYFDLSQSITFILVNGILLLGLSKIFWIEAIHRMPVTKAISLASIGPAFTLIFAYFILGEIPTVWQLLGLVPIISGVLLLTEYRLKSTISLPLTT